MKIEKIGKRYSRVGVARAEDDDDISSMLRFFASNSARLQTWRDQAQNAYDAGCAYLKSKGLPAAASVFSWGDMAHWTEERPPAEAYENQRLGWRTITNHIAHEGFPRDSQEDLAARLIEVADVLLASKPPDNPPDILQAIELGRLQVLWSVYGGEQSAGGMGGSEKQRKWAKDLGFDSLEELRSAALSIWDRDYNGRIKKEAHDAAVAATITHNGSGKTELKPSTVTRWRRERNKKPQPTP